MKKFILIDHEPWTKRRKQLFYDLFEQAGLNLMVWDLSQWLFPGFSNPDEISEASYLKRIRSEQQFHRLIKDIDSSEVIFVEEVQRTWKNRKIFKYLSDYGFQTMKIELYGNAMLKEDLKWKLKYIFNYNPKRLILAHFNSLRVKIYNKIFKIRGISDFIFSSNAIYYRTDKFNHPDYEQFQFHDAPRLIKEDYIVFCDIFFPYHTDLKYFYNSRRIIDGVKYQKEMKDFFDFLEDKYKLPVIIAAHPKSDYKGNEFGERKIIKYETDNLVKYASKVTMHMCNTVSYAIIGKKPIAFIATSDYLNSLSVIRRRFKNLVNRILHQQIYMIDTPTYKENFAFKHINEIDRREYMYTYLTSPETEDKSNIEILREKIWL